MYGKELGEMAWMDLSVSDAKSVSHFYQTVLGWRSEPVSMKLADEKYNDFVMTATVATDSAEAVENEAPSAQSFMTGICHARGENEDMPAVWLPYFLVKNLDDAVLKVLDNGGSLQTRVKTMGVDRYLVIKDPAGAMAAIYQKG